MKRLRELDGLRFFAIAAVLAVHYRPVDSSFFDFMSLGWVGVDLFFVVSGFLITSNLIALRGASHPYRTFYWRRTLRIFPPYYLILLLLCLFKYLDHAPQHSRSLISGLFFLSSLVSAQHSMPHLPHLAAWTFSGAPLDHHFFTSFQDGNGIFWSLSVEELFYLLWAPIVLRCSRRTLWKIAIACLLFCPLLRIVLHTPIYEENFFFPCRLDTLMAGSILALLFFERSQGKIEVASLRRTLRAALLVSVAAFALLCWQAGLFRTIEVRSTLSFAALGYSLLALLFASVVGLAALGAGDSALWRRLLRLRPLVYIGTISYTIYLIHIPAWVIIVRLTSWLRGAQPHPNLWLGLAASLLTVASAAFSWRFFEGPILRLKEASFAMLWIAKRKKEI